MADRVHPNTIPVSGDSQTTSSQKPALPSNAAPSPPGTYVIQVPKDQTYRFPPPENARRYANYTRRKTRRNRCCCCLCWLISILFILVVLVAIAAGVFC
ncbi:NDR1/HIN1 protein [Trifolium repens]|nr:NDR1/HIN1 protein [Trifolium repens]